MRSVPFHAEVLKFAKNLTDHLNKAGGGTLAGGYRVALEHAHSCCVCVVSERLWDREVGDMILTSN
eukprot:595252-Amorphochlora_amoeboformis.AAC.1